MATPDARTRIVDAILGAFNDKIDCTATEAAVIADRLQDRLIDAIASADDDALVECDLETLRAELETVREINKQPADKKAT